MGIRLADIELLFIFTVTVIHFKHFSQSNVNTLYKDRCTDSINKDTRFLLHHISEYTFMFTVIWLHDKNEKLASLCLIVLFKMRQT